LGGAVETDLSAARSMPSLNDAAERMTSLVYLARHYPKARLAFTGGNGELVHAPMPEATVARALWTELGLDQSRIVYESRSRTTYENAVLLKALLKPQPGTCRAPSGCSAMPAGRCCPIRSATRPRRR
jgi:uncharacterized SAM-binding protein YcdF (DUF218 family)